MPRRLLRAQPGRTQNKSVDVVGFTYLRPTTRVSKNVSRNVYLCISQLALHSLQPTQRVITLCCNLAAGNPRVVGLRVPRAPVTNQQ